MFKSRFCDKHLLLFHILAFNLNRDYDHYHTRKYDDFHVNWLCTEDFNRSLYIMGQGSGTISITALRITSLHVYLKTQDHILQGWFAQATTFSFYMLLFYMFFLVMSIYATSSVYYVNERGAARTSNLLPQPKSTHQI